jgi:hypothetical protein
MAHALNSTQRAALQHAVDGLVKATAEELPPDAQISYEVAKVAASIGFTTSDGQFLEQVRDNPISTLLRFILYVG